MIYIWIHKTKFDREPEAIRISLCLQSKNENELLISRVNIHYKKLMAKQGYNRRISNIALCLLPTLPTKKNAEKLKVRIHKKQFQSHATNDMVKW